MALDDTSSDEVTITTSIVRRLVAAQFPRWADLPVAAAATQGVDNATYRLGTEMSVRLPRYSRWIGQVEREQRWLPRLAPHLPLPIPVPLAEGVPSEDYPFPWSVYRWLPGERAVPERLDPDRAAATLAEFLLALQEIPADGGPEPAWSNGFRGCAIADERDSPVVRNRVEDRISALAGLTDVDALTAVYEAAVDAPVWPGSPVWVHGDPAPDNLLADGDRLAAVIDFGTMAVGDPACDLIGAWTLLPAPARAAFRERMSIDDATWTRGRGWALTALLPPPADLSGDDPVRAAKARRQLDELVTDHQRCGVG